MLYLKNNETGERITDFRGREVFNTLLAAEQNAGTNVTAIAGNWGGNSDNLEAFNNAIRAGIPVEVAARNNTFTGIVTRENGYVNLYIEYENSVQLSDGTFASARVIFTR
jgi:hypothetical protein